MYSFRDNLIISVEFDKSTPTLRATRANRAKSDVQIKYHSRVPKRLGELGTEFQTRRSLFSLFSKVLNSF
jgi:hypothetical protein